MHQMYPRTRKNGDPGDDPEPPLKQASGGG